jgi:hypothetical protein
LVRQTSRPETRRIVERLKVDFTELQERDIIKRLPEIINLMGGNNRQIKKLPMNTRLHPEQKITAIDKSPQANILQLNLIRFKCWDTQSANTQRVIRGTGQLNLRDHISSQLLRASNC